MTQRVKVMEAETSLNSQRNSGRLRREEAGDPDRDDSRQSWDQRPILLGRETRSGARAPEQQRRTLQREHRHAGLGVDENAVSVEDAMELLFRLARDTGMTATYRHSVRGAGVTGTGAFVGAMLLGPPGFLIGGAVGGFVAWMTSEEFKPVPQILMELPAAEKQRLCAQVTAVVRNLNWTDARQMISLVMANSTLRERMFGVLTNYVTNELGAQITYRV